MDGSDVLSGAEPPPTRVPPPAVVWLLRVTVVYAVVETVVVVVLLSGNPGVALAAAVAPVVRVALGVATHQGNRVARWAAIVLNGVGVLVGFTSVPPSAWRVEPFLAVVSVVEVVLIATLLVLSLLPSTARWCSPRRPRVEADDVTPADPASGTGTSVVPLRRGTGPTSTRPLVLVPEEQSPTSETGDGTRGCRMCGTRWHSYTAELADTGQLASRPEADVEAVVAWAEVVGLTCRACGGGACRDHMIRLGAEDARCPSCSGRLLPG
ncbi:hypothetical protein [Actinomycetospora termitidis]|uniref:Uncharacterized protein n=1 Tax=Actinomycetospora termitidis TaxID=3053470 RepID=A0ABT7MC75_9PSEU|nr:hypothetical protein [Actinomycetospora sp. Odt1-22]MDL5158260.1 hypothetical protein [Actinomycetospora sp. Odt1-22]